ncbi:tetratricopeptide repeat protein [Candidatus Uabimicrobium sp. HlEnr_7]|uniref:protein kinase domain-containing protein n=1 Tax=Candidatus Uabimicrobium helgolandensis TaxID=3095367 RepID=UPI0035574ACD
MDTKTRYKIDKELGRGGMGVVYKAYDSHLRRYVALKVTTEGSLERFKREYTAMAQLKHPSIVTFYEYGCLPQPFFAMEYVEGETLQQKITQKCLTHDEIVDFAMQICEGLHEAHGKGIFHRDIKPSNIIINKQKQAKIMDFGVAKYVDDNEKTHSKTGEMIGTLLYMSPEQIEGKFSAQSDIYSLGVCIYEALTHRTPYQGTSHINIALQIQDKDPIRPRELNSEISPYLEAICMKCLSRSLKKRYINMRQLAKELKNLKHNKPIIAKKFTYFDQLKHVIRNNKALFSIISIIAMLLFVFNLYSVAKEKKLQSINRELYILNEAMNKFTHNILMSDYEDLFSQRQISQPLYSAFNKSAYLKNAKEYSFLRGVVYGNRDNKQDKRQALKDFKKHIQLDPNSDITYRNIGVLYQQLGDNEKAILYFNKGKIDEDATLLYAKALSLCELKEYTKAITVFSKAIKLDPLNAKYRYQFALLLNTLKKPQQALRQLSKSIEIQPNFAKAYRERAVIFFKSRKLGRAVTDLEQAINLGLISAEIYCDLASMYFERKQYEIALQNGQKAIELNDKYARAYYTLGITYGNLKQYKLSVKYYTKSIDLNPYYFSSYINRGNIYCDLKQYSKAIEDYKKASSIDSKNALSYRNLASLYNEIGLFEEAIKEATLAIELKPYQVNYYQRGLAYHKFKMYPEALRDYNKAITMHSFEIYDKRGDLHSLMQNYSLAIKDWQKALSLAPSVQKNKIIAKIKKLNGKW